MCDLPNEVKAMFVCEGNACKSYMMHKRVQYWLDVLFPKGHQVKVSSSGLNPKKRLNRFCVDALIDRGMGEEVGDYTPHAFQLPYTNTLIYTVGCHNSCIERVHKHVDVEKLAGGGLERAIEILGKIDTKAISIARKLGENSLGIGGRVW